MHHVKLYRAKNGRMQYMPSDAVLLEIIESDNATGFCLSCGEFVDGIEPDAERCECSNCGTVNKTYGAENLMLRGLYFSADREADIEGDFL